MGNSVRKDVKIKIFNDDLSLQEVKQSILKSKVNQDCDFLLFFDCTKSNMFYDGTSLHDIPKHFAKCNNHTLSNPYLLILDIMKQFPFHSNSNFYLYFFGTEKSDRSINKLDQIKYILNESNGLIEQKEYYNSLEELINGYTTAINVNNFFTGVPLNEMIEESINHVKNKKKFTIVIILLNNIIKKYEKKETIKLIKKLIESTNYPLEIICIGVGKENYQLLEGFDKCDYNKLGISSKKLYKFEKNRRFDNFHVVILKKIVKRTLINKNIKDEIFRNMFVEVPQVYNYIQKKNIISYVPNITNNKSDIDDLLINNNFTIKPRPSVMVIDLNDNLNL